MVGEARRELEIAPTLEEIRILQTDRGYRDVHARFFAEGVRNFVCAVQHRYPIEAVVASDLLLTSAIARRLLREVTATGVPLARASPKEFRSVSRAQHASGLGVILRQHWAPLHRMAPRVGTCWVVLSRVRSPGNFGTLVRTSAAVGGAGFILVGGDVDPFDPIVVRATMGALFRQRFVRTGATQLRHWVRRHKLQVVGASPEGTIAHDELHYRRPPVLVLGEERSGLDEEQRKLCEVLVRIPMTEGTDSLNLSVAGSILMYQAYRNAMRRNLRG
jgi:TrmH family RNA methyltransferase